MDSSRSLGVSTVPCSPEYNRIAALAIELRDKLSEVELQLKLIKPIAAEILRTVDNRHDDPTYSKDPVIHAFNNTPSTATDSEMLVGIRWDFEEYSSAPSSVHNSNTGGSTEFPVDSLEKSTASYLWKRMMKKSAKKFNTPSSTAVVASTAARSSVYGEDAASRNLMPKSRESVDAGSITAEVGSVDVLDREFATSSRREGERELGNCVSSSSSSTSNNIHWDSVASGIHEKQDSKDSTRLPSTGALVPHRQASFLLKSDSVHSSQGASGGKASRRANVRLESRLGNNDVAVGGFVKSVSAILSPLSPGIASPADSSAPMVVDYGAAAAAGGSRVKAVGNSGLSSSKGVDEPSPPPVAVYYLFLVWIIPIMVAFDVNSFQREFTITTSVIFLSDSILQSLTIRSDKIDQSSLRLWILRYLAHNLLIDIITIIPFDLLPFGGSDYLLFLRYLRVMRLHEILKKSPIYVKLRYFLEKRMGIGETYFGFFVLFAVIIMSLHVQACAYWTAGRLANFSSTSIKTVQNRTAADQPDNFVERWIVIFFAFINAVLYAVVVGSFSSYVVGLNASARLYRQKVDELNDYMEWKKLPRGTREKVMRYYEIKYRGKFFEESTLLGEMNDSLRTEIAVHNCRELIEKVPFLRRQQNDGRDDQFIGRIARSLSVGYYVNGDYIIRQGEYFIVTGTVKIMVNGNQVATFTDGAFFGEVALIANIPRTASVVAASPSIIYRLTRTEFMDILMEFDDMRVRIDRIYQERMAKVRVERALADAQRGSQVDRATGGMEKSQVEKVPLEKIDTQSMSTTDG
ncbi:anaphase-promoting complex subunit Hcn1 [Dinochytrium kinnereticum]|nr:anaphase-promoting complex subunit Hcn1 [Dinochytrium kinnereticum]